MDRIESARKAARERAAAPGSRAGRVARGRATPEAAENQAKAAAEAMVRAAGDARAVEDQCAPRWLRADSGEHPQRRCLGGTEPLRLHPQSQARPFQFFRQPPGGSPRSPVGRGGAARRHAACGFIRTASSQQRKYSSKPRRRWKPAISTTSRPPPPAISTSRPGRWKSLSCHAKPRPGWTGGTSERPGMLLLGVVALPRQRDVGVRAARRGGNRGRPPVWHPHRRAVPGRTRRAHARFGPGTGRLPDGAISQLIGTDSRPFRHFEAGL